MKLTDADINNMDKMEKITMNSGGGNAFYMRKPLVINQYNAADYEPSIGVDVATFCASQNYSTDTFSLSSPTGTFLGSASLWYGYTHSGGWDNVQARKELWDTDVSAYTFDPNNSPSSSTPFTFGFTPTSIDNKNFFLSSRDSFEREFIRRIECN